MNRLGLFSEPFSPNGNLSAEGFENLLGTPSLELLAVLLREAVQNSCDATRLEPGTARVCLRVRTLDLEQTRILRERVLSELPEEETASENLRSVLFGEQLPEVLEIADYGTTGLAGPTRADQPLKEGENPDFVNFFRNVGAARDVEGRGGTYGYGKATLYRASRAHCIVVDTATTENGRSVRRFMAAQMGRAIPGRITGRHWWGIPSEDGTTVEPATGNQARELAEAIGMPERGSDDSGKGTTIMILAPHLPSTADEVVLALMEYLLWYFWPRMMQTTQKGMKLEGMVASGTQKWRTVENPENFPPLDLLCRAMNALRGYGSEDVEVTEIRKFRPRVDLGRLAIARGRAGARRWLLPPPTGDREMDEDRRLFSILPQQLSHVALMRPAQLVVRYEMGTPDPDPGREWGGVFMCSEEEEIENAFARSEPPAHDDWQPDALPPHSPERSHVRVALKRIREKIAPRTDVSLEPRDGPERPLARPSARMGLLLPGISAEGAGRKRHAGVAGGRRKLPPFGRPRPHALRLDESGNPVAEFEFEVHSAGIGRPVTAQPLVIVDGRPAEPDEATGQPRLHGWLSPEGEQIHDAILCPRDSGSWRAMLSVPDGVAVGLRLIEVEEDAPEKDDD